MPDVRWHDLRATASTTLLVAGFSPKAVSKVMGHAKEILCVDVYGDNRKIAAIKLDRLEDYIDDVIPKNDSKFEKELWEYKIEIDDYISTVAWTNKRSKMMDKLPYMWYDNNRPYRV